MGKLARFCWALTRRKPMDVNDDAPTDLDRCLNTLDLTAMGVGATLGFGLYVLSGEVAAQKAGPGVVLSFMIAAIASTFSALCYAEFAAKVPKSGSAYAYSYITVGEFVAFIIGWNLMLEHVIGTASLARGYSGYLGTLFTSASAVAAPSGGHTAHLQLATDLATANATIGSHTAQQYEVSILGDLVSNFDSLSLFLTVLVTGLLLLGVQVSSRFQITFATINLSVAIFIFICGLFKADFHNWNLTKDEIPATAGAGGFLPFGFSGVIAGAGTCFFAFVGFDGIAATAEEVKNPRKAIPNSIIWTSIIIFFTYCGIATIQTLIWPYWDQKQAAPLPYIFDKLEMPFAKWTILVGVLAGLSTSFVGGFLPLPRILYAMARDGVIYRVLAIVSKRFKVPFVSTIVGGIVIALMASTLEISQLSDMLSIGTLAAYSLVSISVLLLRFEYRRPKTQCGSGSKLEFDAEAALEKVVSSNGKGVKAATSPGSTDCLRDSNLRLAAGNGGDLSASHLLLNNDKKQVDATNNNTTSDGVRHLSGSGGAQVSSASSEASSNLSTSLVTTSSSPTATTTTSNSISSITEHATGPGPKRPLVLVFWQGTASNLLPDEQTTHISRILILLLIISTTLLDFALVIWGPELYLMDPIAVTIITALTVGTLVLTFLLKRLPMTAPSKDSFEVPLVPSIPLFSVVINTYLMLNLSIMTWIRFAVWMSIGFFIYFTYGIFNSTGYKDTRCD